MKIDASIADSSALFTISIMSAGQVASVSEEMIKEGSMSSAISVSPIL